MSRCRHKWANIKGMHAAHRCSKCKVVRTREFATYYYWYHNSQFNWYYKQRIKNEYQ